MFIIYASIREVSPPLLLEVILARVVVGFTLPVSIDG